MILSSSCTPKVLKNENLLTNINLKPKNDLDLVFCMCKGGNPKNIKLNRIPANLVTLVSVWTYIFISGVDFKVFKMKN